MCLFRQRDSISVRNLCYLLCQYVNCIFSHGKVNTEFATVVLCWMVEIAGHIVLRQRRKAEIDWMYWTCFVCLPYAVANLKLLFFTCVINILEIYLPFPLSYTRKTVIVMSLHHNDSTSLTVKLSWLLKSLMILRELLMERKCVVSHAWVNLHSERRNHFVLL